MSQSADQSADTGETVYEEYIMDVRIVEIEGEDGTRYRFKAPDHCGKTFYDSEIATLYAAIYFDTNGFVEADTGDRGIPPSVVQGSRDTLVAYMYTTPGADTDWVSCYFAERPDRIRRMVENVRARARKIRASAREHGVDEPSTGNVEG